MNLKNPLTALFALIVALFLSTFAAAAATLTVSPNTVADSYSGLITLQIGGINSGETVTVEELTDMAGSGSPGANDLTLQAFPVTDGKAISFGGVTNKLVPGDMNTTAGNITVQVHMSSLGFDQHVVTKRIYRVSSPSNRFTAVTAAFTVTNASYTATIAGQVKSVGTNVPYASVMFFQPVGSDGDIAPKMMGTTDSQGNYSLKISPGVYLLAAFKNNYMVGLAAPVIVQVGGGQTITTNITLLPTNRKIAGRMFDQDNSTRGLGGVLVIAEGPAGELAVGYSDKDGNFSVGVSAGVWGIGPDEASLNFLGYVANDSQATVDTTSGNVTGIQASFPAATGMVYGTVQNDSGAALPGVQLYSGEWNQALAGTARTDETGTYYTPIIGGNWELQVDLDRTLDLGPIIVTRGLQGATLGGGTATRKDFTIKAAPNTITGYVRDVNGVPLSNLQMWGEATLNGIVYASHGMTDDSGFYSLAATLASWQLGPDCGGDNGLSQRGYQCVSTNAVVTGANVAANFVVSSCGGMEILTRSLPNGDVGLPYQQTLMAQSCSGNSFSWNVQNGNLPPGLTLDNNGQLHGTPTQGGNWTFTVKAMSGPESATQSLTITVQTSQPLSVGTASLASGQVGLTYSANLEAIGGTPPYRWTMALGSGPLPPGLTLFSDGIISGTPTTWGDYFFRIRVTDAANATAEQLLRLFVAQTAEPLNITTTSLPDATVGQPYSAAVAAIGGILPYQWNLALGSAGLPPGLGMTSNYGVVSGTPTQAGAYYFIIHLQDSGVPVNTDEQMLSITVKSGTVTRPELSAPFIGSDGIFRCTVKGTPGASYTLQVCTDLQTWTNSITTNAPFESFVLTAPASSAPQAFYRLRVN